jgi:hypothetical protein
MKLKNNKVTTGRIFIYLFICDIFNGAVCSSDCKRKTRGRLMNYYRKEDYIPSK